MRTQFSTRLRFPVRVIAPLLDVSPVQQLRGSASRRRASVPALYHLPTRFSLCYSALSRRSPGRLSAGRACTPSGRGPPRLCATPSPRPPFLLTTRANAVSRSQSRAGRTSTCPSPCLPRKQYPRLTVGTSRFFAPTLLRASSLGHPGTLWSRDAWCGGRVTSCWSRPVALRAVGPLATLPSRTTGLTASAPASEDAFPFSLYCRLPTRP